jgi:hypothetical protein
MVIKSSVLSPVILFEEMKQALLTELAPYLKTKSDEADIEVIFNLPHIKQMTIGEKLNFESSFKFTPLAVVGLKVKSSTPESQRTLGDCTLIAAAFLKGIICFCGSLETPASKSTVRSNSEKRIAEEKATNRIFAGIPGLLKVIPYEENKGELNVAHYCDVEFMKSWIQNPYFHMNKT